MLIFSHIGLFLNIQVPNRMRKYMSLAHLLEVYHYQKACSWTDLFNFEAMHSKGSYRQLLEGNPVKNAKTGENRLLLAKDAKAP